MSKGEKKKKYSSTQLHTTARLKKRVERTIDFDGNDSPMNKQ